MLTKRGPAVLLVVVAACGSPIAVRDLPGALEDSNCDLAVECQRMPSAAACDAASDLGHDNDSLTIFADVDAGVIIYNADAAQACLDERNAGSCVFAGFHGTTVPDPCDQILTGTLATGAACMIDAECAGSAPCIETSATCDRSVACCPGTCGTPQPAAVALNGVCDNETLFCAANSYCRQVGTSGTGTCAPLITGLGSPCDSEFSSCANPLYCNLDFGGTGAPETCKAAAASGAACVATDGLPCGDAREYCDPAMNKCVPRVAAGAACPTGVRCVGFATCIAAICVARPGLGEACVVDTAPNCLGDLSCVAGTCQAAPVGMSCR